VTAIILAEAEGDVEGAFNYYQEQRSGLGVEFLGEFRRGIEQILTHPDAWQAMDAIYRRYRLHRFPYGIIYRIDPKLPQIIVVATMHLSQKPGWWRPGRAK
jgi:plasmid stabilization system protein ParE